MTVAVLLMLRSNLQSAASPGLIAPASINLVPLNPVILSILLEPGYSENHCPVRDARSCRQAPGTPFEQPIMAAWQSEVDEALEPCEDKAAEEEGKDDVA
ncbi:hypothetical protein DPSP01_013246 [Paraphaeosphaeria sporulosa]